MATLSVADLFNISDGGVVAYVNTVMRAMVASAPSVKPSFPSSGNLYTPLDPGFFDNAAAALVCSSIARTTQYNFARTIKMKESDDYWNAALQSPAARHQARTSYDYYFSGYASAGASTFNDYLIERFLWATELSSHVTTDAFINVLMNKLSIHETDWQHKTLLTLYKLNLLDNEVCARVHTTWTARGIPGIEGDWNQRIYAYNPDFRNDEYINEVNAAIAQVTTERDPGHGHGTSHSWTTYGRAVQDFVNGKATAIGLATGTQPDNSHESSPGKGCFIAGTMVLLAGGASKRIEEVAEGDVVVAQNGEKSERSDEFVRLELDEPLTIYGFNDIAPFFSAGHLFATDEGWKAIDPAIALEENPTGRTIRRLTIGDIVHHVISVDPFCYERVRIERFRTRTLDAGDAIYGLHLLGARSYHVNGFCVAMNYPLITAKRLMDGFAKLTDEERRLVAHQLEPILPLLSKAIGSFVDAPLRRALQQTKEEVWS